LEANPIDFPTSKGGHLHRVKATGFRPTVDFGRNEPNSEFWKRDPLTPTHHEEGFFRQGSASWYHEIGSLWSLDHDSYELNIQVFREKSSIAEITELIFAPLVDKMASCAKSVDAPSGLYGGVVAIHHVFMTEPPPGGRPYREGRR
jgi:hypothetical protein